MSTTLPFILHILVAAGDPDGLRVVECSNLCAQGETTGQQKLASLKKGLLGAAFRGKL